MMTEHVYFWMIPWAGRWMLTTRRFSEREIKATHPEAKRVDGSEETVVVPQAVAASVQPVTWPMSGNWAKQG